MDCEELKTLLVAYLDNETAPKEQHLIGEHLAVCQLCREKLDELTIIQAKLRQTFNVAVYRTEHSIGTWARIKREIEENSTVLAKGGDQGVKSIFSAPWIINLLSRRSELRLNIRGAFNNATEKFNNTKKGAIITMKNILTSRQPLWRTALAAILVTTLVFSLSVILPSFLGQSSSVMAIEDGVMQTLKSDSRTKTLLDEGAVVNYLEKDYRGDVISTLEDRAGKTVVAQKTEVFIMAQRILVEIALGDKIYMADVDILNDQVLSFGEKGSPDFRTICPRFDADIVGEMLNEEGETLGFTYNNISTQSFEGIEWYIDPLYEDTISDKITIPIEGILQ